MKRLKWLLELANGKPLIFSIALLLIAVSVLAIVVKNRDNKIDDCNLDKRLIENHYNNKLDSLVVYYRKREIQLNDDIKATLNSMIADYKQQIAEHQHLDDKIRGVINDNKKVINQTRNKTKNLLQ